MSHFAEVIKGIVVSVIVADQEYIDGLKPTPEKPHESPDHYVQTSYNTRGGKHYAPNSHEEDSGTPLRKNYAGIGFTYDSVKDAFYAPKPYPSWLLNDTTCLWDAPVAYPDDGKRYQWDEDNTTWKEIES